MGLIELAVLLVVIFTLLYCFNRWWTWIDPPGKKIVNVVVLVGAILIILYAFGFFNMFHGDMRVPQIR